MQAITMSAHSSRAIRAGRKTQTRRPIKELEPGAAVLQWIPPQEWATGRARATWHAEIPHKLPPHEQRPIWCRFGTAGDFLWVREPWCRDTFGIHYAGELGDQTRRRWKSARFMPRDVAELELEILEIRVERLQAITAADAIAEGVELENEAAAVWNAGDAGQAAIDSFAMHWNRLHATDGLAWAADPWVWVVRFSPIGAPADADPQRVPGQPFPQAGG